MLPTTTTIRFVMQHGNLQDYSAFVYELDAPVATRSRIVATSSLLTI